MTAAGGPVRTRVLVTGAEGQLGRDLTAAFSGTAPDGGDPSAGSTRAGLPAAGTVDVLATDVAEMDIVDRDVVQSVVDMFRPDIVVHAAAATGVDACELDPTMAYAVNAMGTRNVAEATARAGAHLVAVSTDYVFDGALGRPYTEWDPPGPRSVYGQSKLAGEREATAACPGATVVRTAWVSGVHGANMVKTVLRLAADPGPGPLRFVDDQVGTPTFTADLAPAVVRLALDRRPGTYHVTNTGETSWFGFARAVLAAAGLDPDVVEAIATPDLDPPRPAPRPADSRLDALAWRLAGLPPLPAWTEALDRLVGALSVVAGT